MFDQMSRFVSRFRELEQQGYTQTREEERQWNLLKSKLAAPQAEEQHQAMSRKCIAVTSLYEQAGASFVAGNVAYSLASQGIPVTLCEIPGSTSYYYFSLDFERRAKASMNHSSASVLLMQNNFLRIQINPPYLHHPTSHTDIADWLLRTNKESSVVVIDLSSRWREAEATRILDFADEIWMIFDTDFARLTRLFLTESAPPWWNHASTKMTWVANKWNDRLARSGMKKKVEGTLTLWNTESNSATIDAVLPQFDGEKISMAQAKGSLLLERYPEEESYFYPLVNACKGRML